MWVGVNEEIHSRGLVQQTLTPLGVMRAAVGVAVLFGAGHLQNYLFFGAQLNDTLWQMLSATLFGFACAGPRYAIGSVWPLVVVHALDEFFQIRSPGAAPDWWQGGVYVFHVAYGLWLLHRYAYAAEDAPTLRASIRTDPGERPEGAEALD
nr:CPBP family intramembrane glutamic endopeptidase [Streptomyces sp. MK5]